VKGEGGGISGAGGIGGWTGHLPCIQSKGLSSSRKWTGDAGIGSRKNRGPAVGTGKIDLIYGALARTGVRREKVRLGRGARVRLAWRDSLKKRDQLGVGPAGVESSRTGGESTAEKD